MTLDAERLALLEGIELERGVHLTPSEATTPGWGFCVMEAVAYVAGEPWTDHPRCACPVLTTFMTAWNDALSASDRQRLKRYIPRLAGSRATPEVESIRAWMGCDWLVRVFAVAWLRRGGFVERADALAAIPELTSIASLASAQPVLEQARSEASDVWRGVRSATWSAGGAALDAAHGEGYGPSHGAPYAAALDTDPAPASDEARGPREAALDAVRSAALAAGMVGGRGAAFGAALGGAFDTALDAALDTTLSAVRTAEPGEARDAALDAVQGVVGHAARTAIPDMSYVAALGAAYDAAIDSLFSIAYAPAYGAALGAASGGDVVPRDAVRAAALGAARGVLAPTVRALQDSAFGLLDRMLAVEP